MTLSRCALVLTLSTLPAVAAAAPITVTQSLTYTTVAGFGTFSVASTTVGNWTGALWPFTQASQIERVSFSFSSQDQRWTTGIGPSGGDTGVEIGLIGEYGSSQRTALVSVGPSTPPLEFTDGNPGTQSTVDALRSLLLDGVLTVSLGAFENFPLALPAFSRSFALDAGASTLSVSVSGSVLQTVPEPSALLLLLTGATSLFGMRRFVPA